MKNSIEVSEDKNWRNLSKSRAKKDKGQKRGDKNEKIRGQVHKDKFTLDERSSQKTGQRNLLMKHFKCISQNGMT